MTDDTKRYEKPRVTEYGGFEEITEGGQGKGSVGGDEASKYKP